MKKAIRKISAIAMAITLLGAGSVISGKISSEPVTLTANAATCTHCHGGSAHIGYRNVYIYGSGGYFKKVPYCTLCGHDC